MAASGRNLFLASYILGVLGTLASAYVCPGEDWYYRKGTQTCYYVANPNEGSIYDDAVIRQTWDEVLRECRVRGGRLLTLDSTDEFEFVKAKIKDPNTYYWVGLTFENLTWAWYDGVNPSRPYIPGSILGFEPSQLDPVEGNRNKRISLKYNSWQGTFSLFNDWTDSNNRNGYICEGDWGAKPLCKTEEGWSYRDGACHKFYPNPWSFDWAQYDCNLDGGYVAVVSSEAEDKRYKDWLRTRLNVEKGWLGIEIKQKNSSTSVDNVKWLDGTPITPNPINNWETTNLATYISNLPNGDRYCGEVSTKAEHWSNGWQDDVHDWALVPNCTVAKPYMCEMKQNKCPYGWKQFQDNCYQFNAGLDNMKTWEQAREKCKLEMGDLVTITTAEEQAFVRGNLRDLFDWEDYDAQHYWIGLKAGGGQFKWVDGTSVGYTDWSDDATSLPANDPCVFIDGNVRWSFGISAELGDWNISTCSMEFRYICEAHNSAAIPPDVVIHPDITCEKGFVRYHENCYNFVKEPKNRDDAQRHCQGLGSNLFKVNTVGENAWIRGQITEDNWIGLKRTAADGSYCAYTYADNSCMGPGGFKHFYDTNYVFNGDTSDRLCVAMAGTDSQYNTTMTWVPRTPHGEWYHLPCTETRQFICQHPGTPLPVPPPDNDHYDPLCGAGWFRHQQNCYRVQKTYETWQSAKQICQNYDDNSDLLYITSKVEDTFIRDVMMNNYSTNFWTDHYWIDLYADADGVWYWPFRNIKNRWHVPFAVSHWATGEPFHNTGITADVPKCATIDNHPLVPRWYSQFCAQTRAFICKKELPRIAPLEPVTQKPTARPGYYIGCRRGWSNVNGRCLHYNISSATWFEARGACRGNGNGGELASIRDQQELADYFFANGAWIGLNAVADPFEPRVFTWTDGSDVGYTPWDVESATGNVTGSAANNANCGAMTRTGFAIYPCGERKSFVCEKELEQIQGSNPDSVEIPHAHGCQLWGVGFGSSCYYFGENPTTTNGQRDFHTFDGARQFCRNNFNGDLVVIKNQDEQQFLAALVSKFGSDYWIGLKEEANPWDAFRRWIDNSTVSTTNWGYNMPPVTHSGTTGCVAMYSTYSDHVMPGRWYVNSCTERKFALCKSSRSGLPSTPAPPTSTPSPTGCPANWKTEPGLSSCYRGYRGLSAQYAKITWQMAEDFCRQFRNGHLVSIGSNDENYFVDMKVQPGWSSGYQYWIGLRETWEGYWEWSDGSPITLEWFHQTLDHQTAETRDCVAMESMSGRWVTQSCQQAWGWMCEIPKGAYYEGQEVSEFPAPNLPNATCGGITANGDWFFDPSAMECVFWSNLADTWENAQATCEDMDADLITVTENRYDFVTVNTAQHTNMPASFWIGLRMTDMDNMKWEWVDGRVSQFTAWGPEQPRPWGLDRCAVHNSGSGRWETHNCGRSFRYICGKSGRARPPRPTGTPPPTGNCEPGWVRHGYHCYYVSRAVNMTWEEAHVQCTQNLTIQMGHNHSSELVSIHNSLENDFLITLVKGRHHYDFWTGLHNFGVGAWVWSDQSPVTYFNWRSGQNLYGAEGDCGVFGSRRNDAGKWRRAKCETEPRGFICRARTDTTLPAPSRPTTQCLANYVPFGENSCFSVQKLEAGQSNWDAAQRICMEMGDKYGNIATAEDVFDNAQFRILLSESQELHRRNGTAWIGMREHLGVFSWHNTCPVVFSNFENLNVAPGKDHCVVMDHHGRWVAKECQEEADFVVCERRFKACEPAHDDTSDTYCPNNFPSECKNTCYRVEVMQSHNERPEHVRRKEAQEECRKLGGHLASVRTQEDQQCLMKYMEHAVGPMWFGLYQAEIDGKWVWKWEDDRHNQEAPSFLNWQTGHPKNATSQWWRYDCGEMQPNGTWLNSDCDGWETRGYICEGGKERGSRRTTTLPPDHSGNVRPDDKKAGPAVDEGLGGGAIAGIVIGVLIGVVLVAGIGYMVKTGKTAAVMGSVRNVGSRVRTTASTRWTSAGFKNSNYEQHNDDRRPVAQDSDFHGRNDDSYT